MIVTAGGVIVWTNVSIVNALCYNKIKWYKEVMVLITRW